MPRRRRSDAEPAAIRRYHSATCSFSCQFLCARVMTLGAGRVDEDRKRGIGENLGRYASKDEGRNAPSSVRRPRDKVAACFGGGAHDCAVRLVVFGVNDRVPTTSAACAIACAAANVCSARCFMCRRVFGRRVLGFARRPPAKRCETAP